jgi:hypothetical protein
MTDRQAPPSDSVFAVLNEIGICAQLSANAFERVMPGRNYVASIRDFWRVCSGSSGRFGPDCHRH